MRRRAPDARGGARAAISAAILAAPLLGGCRSLQLTDALEGTFWRGIANLTPLYEDGVLIGEPNHTGVGIWLELNEGGDALLRLEKTLSCRWKVRESDGIDQIDLTGFDGSDGLGIDLIPDPSDPDTIQALEFTDVEGRVSQLEPVGDGGVDPSEIVGDWRSEETWPHPDGVEVQSTLSIVEDGDQHRGTWGLVLSYRDDNVDWMSGPMTIWTRPSDGQSFWTVEPFSDDGGPSWWIFGGEIDLEGDHLYGPVDIDPAVSSESYAAYALTPDG